MASPRLPIMAGFLGAVATLAIILAPAVVADFTEPDAIRLYYGFGIGGLWALAAIAAVLAIVFAAAWTGRTDDVFAASVGFGGGIVMILVAAVWAASVDQAVVEAITPAAWIALHRWLVVLVTLVPAIASLWLARQRNLL